MKVVFCAYDGKNIINGVNTWLLTLLPALKKNNITVKVIVIAWAQEQDCTTIPLLKKAGIECTIINPSKKYIQNEIKWILKYINKEMPDVFIANTMLPAYYASNWIEKANIPTVYVIHSDNSWNNGVIEAALTERGPFKFKAIVAVSIYLYSKFSFCRDKAIVKKIPCGVSVISNKAKYTDSPFKIAYVGRLAQHEKRIGDIVTAFCETVINIPNLEAYIYGSGPDGDLINSILDRYSKPANIFLKGNIAHSEIYAELNNMHAIVLMSDLEGLPVSFMEAMSLGVVPLSTKIQSGIPELLINNYTGLFIENSGDLVNKVKWLVKNPDEWERLSLNAKKHIKENYAADISTSNWISLFNEITPQKKRKIKIPYRIKMPLENSNFSMDENREPNLVVKLYKKLKKIL